MHTDRIAIAGAGSIGCYVGGCLAAAGRTVTLLARPALGAAIARHGLRVSDLDGADRTLPPDAIAVATDAAALTGADMVLVTVKSGATAAMAETIALHAPQATVISLQNGVGNVDIIRARLPRARVVPAMVPFNVVQTSVQGQAARFHRATSGIIRIAPAPDVSAALNVAGAPVAEHSDMTGVLWGKLVLNLNNALNALSGLPLAAQLADRRWRKVLAAQVAEALRVMRAANVRAARVEGVHPRMVPAILRLPDPVFRLVAGRMLAIDPAARSSMWEDLERRRVTELDYLQGAILELAARCGVTAPLTQRIAGLVKDAERAGRGSPRLAPDQVRAGA